MIENKAGRGNILNFFVYKLENLKGKTVLLGAWIGPECSRKLRFPDFMTTAQGCGKKPYAPAAFTPRKCFWYSFLLEAESTPGLQCDRKDFMSMKNSNDTSWDRTSDLPICSTAPQPLCYRGPNIPLQPLQKNYILNCYHVDIIINMGSHST